MTDFMGDVFSRRVRVSLTGKMKIEPQPRSSERHFGEWKPHNMLLAAQKLLSEIEGRSQVEERV